MRLLTRQRLRKGTRNSTTFLHFSMAKNLVRGAEGTLSGFAADSADPCRWTCSFAMASDTSPTDKDLNLSIFHYRERTAVRVVPKMPRYSLGL
jgi:hypothetical protein